jgi:hypothetical protein
MVLCYRHNAPEKPRPPKPTPPPDVFEPDDDLYYQGPPRQGRSPSAAPTLAAPAAPPAPAAPAAPSKPKPPALSADDIRAMGWQQAK